MALKSLILARAERGLKAAPAAALLASLALAGCAQLGRLAPSPGGALAPIGSPSRADIAKSGQPVMLLRLPSRRIETFLTLVERRGPFETWSSADGMTFAFKDQVLIETRGLGADLMSSAAPSAARIAAGGSHNRSYFFVSDEDQTEARHYSCSIAEAGSEEVILFGQRHTTRKRNEICSRPEGRLTNGYWLEGTIIRKSFEWVSPEIGRAEFSRVID